MSKTKKITFFNFFPHECEAAAEYFESMAEKGWKLKSIKGAYIKFIKIEPKKIKYSVDVLHKVSEFDRANSEAALEYREYCMAAGWDYICEKGKIQVFCTTEYEDIIPIHTDEEERFKSVCKASILNISCQIILILALIFNIYIQVFVGNVDYLFSTNLGLFSVFVMGSAIIVNSTDIISFFIWLVRAKKHLKDDKMMYYNSFNHVKSKSLFKNTYFLLGIGILLSLLFFDNTTSYDFIIMVFIMILPLAFTILVKIFINKKRYSKNINIGIYVTSLFASFILVLFLTGAVAFRGITTFRANDIANEKIRLTLTDFGHKEDKSSEPYAVFDRSIIAERTKYITSSEGNDLDYTIFKSNFSWIIKFDENMLLKNLSKYGEKLYKSNTKLPSHIKVYSDGKQTSFILVSEDRIVNIRNNFSKDSEDEFLDIVYKKLFKG